MNIIKPAWSSQEQKSIGNKIKNGQIRRKRLKKTSCPLLPPLDYLIGGCTKLKENRCFFLILVGLVVFGLLILIFFIFTMWSNPVTFGKSVSNVVPDGIKPDFVEGSAWSFMGIHFGLSDINSNQDNSFSDDETVDNNSQATAGMEDQEADDVVEGQECKDKHENLLPSFETVELQCPMTSDQSVRINCSDLNHVKSDMKRAEGCGDFFRPVQPVEDEDSNVCDWLYRKLDLDFRCPPQSLNPTFLEFLTQHRVVSEETMSPVESEVVADEEDQAICVEPAVFFECYECHVTPPSFAAPTVWNNLPSKLRAISSHQAFKRGLKTHLFNLT